MELSQETIKANAVKNGQRTSAPHPGNIGVNVQNGLTKREHFAIMALQGYLASGRAVITKETTTQLAIEYADLLLLKLEETEL